MKVEFNIDKKEAIKNGSEKYGTQTFEFELSHFDKDELAFLANCKTNEYDKTITDLFRHNYSFGDNVLTYNNNITFEQSLDIIATIKSKIQDAIKNYAELEQLEATRQNLIACNNQKIIDFINQTDTQEIFRNFCRYDYIDLDKIFYNLKLKTSDFYHYAESRSLSKYNEEFIKDSCSKKYSEIDQFREKLKQEQIEYQKQQKIEQENKEANFKNWAIKNGSEKTQMMLKHNFENWASSAQKDYVSHILAQYLPDFEIGANDGQARKNPSLEELEALDFVVELAKEKPDLFIEPQLQRILDEEYQNDTGEDKYFNEIQLKIVCLDGSTHWVSKTIA